MSSRARAARAAVAAVVGVLLVLPSTTGEAAADPIVATITLQGESGAGILSISDQGIEALDLDGDLQGGCGFPIDATESLCLGVPLASDETLAVGGITVDPFVRAGGEAADALRWIVDEGVQAIRSYYAVPLDYRIERYATAEIRAYIQNRILDILDKAAYDEPLTADESATLAFVEGQALQLERKITRYAYEEYLEWRNDGCDYAPPTAPTWVTAPVTSPSNVVSWCSRAHTMYETLFTFAPPAPSAGHFLTWGMYRNAADLGLDGFDETRSQAQLLEGITAGIVLGGVATAIAAAGGTAAIVGSSAALSAAAAGAMGSFAATSTAIGVLGPAGVASAFASVGPAAAATVVAVVVLAAVVISISVVQLVEREQIGATLQARMTEATRATDPFGLVALAAARGHLDVREGLTSANLPGYRKNETLSRLWQFVMQWTSIDRAGTFHPDADDVWDDNDTSVRDHRFEVRIDGGAPEVVDSIVVPVGDGKTATVRFSKSWLIVTPEGGTPGPALSFGYVDDLDRVAFVARDGDAGFVVTREDALLGTIPGVRLASIRYRDAGDRLVEVRLTSPAAQLLSGPRPTAVGPLVPGRVVNLRPNPVSETGEFALDRFRTDYSYVWEVSRFDSATQAWVSVPTDTPAEYGTRFTPDAVGSHRAVVTMTDEVGDESEASGVVEFAIAPPEIGVDLLELVDTGEEDLTLRLRLSETVAEDDFELTVEWPGAFGSAPVVDTRSFVCGTLGIDCESALQTVTHTLDEHADVSRGVTVTVRNGYGNSVSRHLEIAGEERLTFAAPLAGPSPTQLGVVEYSGHSASVQIPIEVDGPAAYEVATVVPGGDEELREFGFYDPDTGQTHPTVFPLGAASSVRISLVEDVASGETVIAISGQPGLDEIGIYEFPLVVQQNSPSATVRTAFLVRLDVVAAPGDRFRGALLADLGPTLAVSEVPTLETQIIGGRAEWGEPDARICVSFEYVADPAGRTELCDDPPAFFDPDGKPYPFPYASLFPQGLRSGLHEARITLPDASDEVSAEPHSVRFSLQSGPPVVDSLDWDDTPGVVRMQVTAPSGTSLTGVSCTLDGVAVPCFEDDHATWSPGTLAAGEHELVVVPSLDTANFTTARLDFTVSGATAGPGDAGAPGAPVPAPSPPTPAPSPTSTPTPSPTPTPAPTSDPDAGADHPAPSPPDPTTAAGPDDGAALTVLLVVLGVVLLGGVAFGGVWFFRRPGV